MAKASKIQASAMDYKCFYCQEILKELSYVKENDIWMGDFHGKTMFCGR